MNISATIQRFLAIRQKFDGLQPFFASVVRQYQDVLLQLNKDGILLGRNTDGQEFQPGYLTDPYFQDPADAQRYFRYKESIRQMNRARIMFPLNYVEKGADTPDLRATKKTFAPGENFQDSMHITLLAEEFFISSSYADTPAIVSKYQNKVFGLTPEAIQYFKDNYSLPALRIYLEN